MLFVNRRRCIALLLIIIVSHTAFSVHVATHAIGNQTGCEPCAGHGNPAHAVPVSTCALQLPADVTLEADRAQSAQFATLVAHYRQRAPPHIA